MEENICSTYLAGGKTVNINGALIDTADEVLANDRKKRPWVTDDLLDLCDKRRSLNQEKKKR